MVHYERTRAARSHPLYRCEQTGASFPIALCKSNQKMRGGAQEAKVSEIGVSNVNLNLIRVLEIECERFRVRLHKPKDVKSFLEHLGHLHLERKKADNVMLDEVEHDILVKEKFISEQVRTLTEMQTNMNTLIEHKNVLLIA